MSAETMHTEVVESSNLDNELNTAIKKSKEDLSSLQYSIEKIDDDKKRLKKGEELEKKATALEKNLGPVRSYRLSEVKNNYIEARGKYLQDPKNENYKKLQESIVLLSFQVSEVEKSIAEFTTNGENESKGKPSLEPDPEHGGRKIVKTETFKDEDGHSITKNVYEDGSMSEGYEENRRVYGYTEYYPNSNIEKFHIFKDGHYVGSRRREAWTSYIIRDEQGKILYEEGWAGPDGCDGWEEFDKYDEKGRLIYRERDNQNKLIYDDENNTVSHIIEPFNALYKQISVYSLNKRGEINRDNEISRVFVGETGVEIDLMNGGVKKLINDRNLNDIPNIRDYDGYGLGLN